MRAYYCLFLWYGSENPLYGPLCGAIRGIRDSRRGGGLFVAVRFAHCHLGGTRGTHPGAPTDRGGGGGNTTTQNAGDTLGGTRASAADKEEGGSEAGKATRTAGTWNQKVEDGRACAWGAGTTQGMAWPASPVATGCQGNPCSTGIMRRVSPVARWTVCATGGGAHLGQTSPEGERDNKGPLENAFCAPQVRRRV